MRLSTASLCVLSTLSLTLAALPATASPAGDAFARLQGLAGSWHVSGEGSAPQTATYEVVADGSAVMERLEGMVTMYTLDGDTLYAVHYCMAHNQPKLKAVAFGPDEIRFEEVEVAGLPTPGAGHMGAVTFHFAGPDAFTQDWTWRENGADAGVHQIVWKR